MHSEAIAAAAKSHAGALMVNTIEAARAALAQTMLTKHKAKRDTTPTIPSGTQAPDNFCYPVFEHILPIGGEPGESSLAS